MILAEQYQRFRREARAFTREVIEPRATMHDQTGEFVKDNVQALAERGWLGIPWPRELGGMGLDYQSYAIAVEEVSRVCASTGLTLAAHTSLGTYPIYKFGTTEQKEKYIPRLALGVYLGAFGLTEPNAGSDAAGIETTAKKTEKGYVINGSKRFITSASYAGAVIVAASLDRNLGRKGVTCFIAETATPGFKVASVEHKLGLKGSDTAELVFEDMLVPLDSVLGKEYDGYRIFMETLDGGRISIGAFCLGMAQCALDTMTTWFRDRELTQLQSKALADVAVQVEAARLLVYNAAQIKDTGVRVDKECAFAKLFASETAMWACGVAIDAIGPLAITSDMPVARAYCDAKLGEIGEGTSEVMRMIIAKDVLKEAKESC
ncbi:MAG: acyl-CoA dehydrogenase family protein [candidate division WOR-3 bacterium]|nr:acyl-CoA dehydrogenase family protein [candidate division WOR-3 bacterium]